MSTTEFFLDTNVIVYALTPSSAKAERAGDLVAVGGLISVQVLNEFATVARRKYRLEWPWVRARLQELQELLTIVPVTLDIHRRGVELSERYGVGVYDAMVVAAAQLAGCTTLWSEDMHDGLTIDRLTIRNPFK